jgi:hypothetical protein
MNISAKDSYADQLRTERRNFIFISVFLIFLKLTGATIGSLGVSGIGIHMPGSISLIDTKIKAFLWVMWGYLFIRYYQLLRVILSYEHFATEFCRIAIQTKGISLLDTLKASNIRNLLPQYTINKRIPKCYTVLWQHNLILIPIPERDFKYDKDFYCFKANNRFRLFVILFYLWVRVIILGAYSSEYFFPLFLAIVTPFLYIFSIVKLILLKTYIFLRHF